MKKVFTQLAVSIVLLSGMLLTTTEATAQQQFVASDLHLLEAPALREASQLRAGKVTPLKNSKYVAKDITGKEYNVDAILKSGRAIMIDFSAVWCGPCWALHQSGCLEKLYTKFGPKGSNRIEIFWVGADMTSSVDAIKGKGGGSKGDWTKDANGKPVPYPLFSDTKMYNALGIPVTGYPTLVLVGPGNKWVECRSEVQTSDTQFKQFEQLLTLFMSENDKPAGLQFSGVTDLYVGETHTMKLSYKTLAPVTSVKWQAPDGITLTKVTDTEYNVTASTPGSYEITATVTNKNGEAKSMVTVTVSDHITEYPFVATMDVTDKLDKGWRSIDHDGDGHGFDSFAGDGLMKRLGLVFKDPNYKPGAENSNDCLISFGKFYPTDFNNGRFSGITINPQNELLSAPLVIPADAKAPTFSCYIASYFDVEKPDQLKVMVTEKDSNPVELFSSQKNTSTWKNISADLSAYKGKTILISLIPVVNGESGLIVDQIRVTMDGSTDVDTPSLNVQTLLYPNPATDFITVQTRIGSTIELFTIEGSIVSITKTIAETTKLSVAQLPAGYYIARITSLDGETVRRPVIIR